MHLLTLARFPLVHSDEAWLAGLTRTMLSEGSLAATEEFFALYPRFPHALRSLYHLVQMPFIAFGFTPSMSRLPSLLAGLGALFLAYRIGRILLPRLSWILPLLLAADVQFWYGAHFGRQEIFILLMLLWALERSAAPGRGPLIRASQTGAILALAVGFHPNAFIIALGIGGFWAGRGFTVENGEERRKLLLALAALIGPVVIGALLFLMASFRMNPAFAADYGALGSGQGVNSRFLVKFLEFPRFLGRIWRGVSGTYYMPEVRPQLLLFAASTLLSLPLLASREARVRLLPLLGLLIGVAAGILIIGKYSPPSVLLLFAPGYLILLTVVDHLLPRGRGLPLMGLVFALIFAWVSAAEITAAYRADYPRLMEELAEALPEEGRVLGNLNLAYALEEGRLRDYRDLGYLYKKGMNVAEYLKDQRIETIILTSELELINRERPVWNRMYGNPYYWFEELLAVTEEQGKLTAEIPAPWYGVRLFHWMGRGEYPIRIYRLDGEAPATPSP